MRYVILCCLICFSTQLNASFKLENRLGKRADKVQIDPALIPEPPLSKTNKSFVTQNRFGFDGIKPDQNWVLDTFLNDIKLGMVVLDVGSGYGALTRHALDRGATVISNDIDWKHLVYAVKHLSLEKRSRLHLNAKDIRKLELEENSLDLIVFERVLHFFKGDEIESLLKKSLKWLKQNGKIYIVMISNEHPDFRGKINYDMSKKWPGEDLMIPKKHFPTFAYALPDTVHVMAIETLKPHLENIGFKIEKADFVSLAREGTKVAHHNKEGIGIVAIKE